MNFLKGLFLNDKSNPDSADSRQLGSVAAWVSAIGISVAVIVKWWIDSKPIDQNIVWIVVALLTAGGLISAAQSKYDAGNLQNLPPK